MRQTDLRVGIIATGWIAEKAAFTIQRMEGATCHAVASRTLQKAQDFAAKWGIPCAYGSYSELLDAEDIDLVYVGTPHSHHFDVTMEAIEKGKPCLVEKAFMANYDQALQVVQKAREKKVFLAEAIWTRYQPIVQTIRDIIKSGRLGELRLLTGSIGYSMGDKPRIMRADLCGGALLDLGVYGINFVRMFCDAKIEQIESQCMKSDTGMDLTNMISWRMEGGIMANIQSTACCVNDNQGTICGTEGYLIVDNINNPQSVKIYKRDRVFVEEIKVPQQITGYEYQFLACKDAINNGLTETPYMPLDETLYIMKLMDDLRFKWGVVYPMDGR
ncbi:MAG: Gfo/Idh/MocA family oxidoreductase [Prevotella sp.]|nr:Gfo/Idh/MocA family oxidoreductase [Prevotella sp.]